MSIPAEACTARAGRVVVELAGRFSNRMVFRFLGGLLVVVWSNEGFIIAESAIGAAAELMIAECAGGMISGLGGVKVSLLACVAG